MNYPTTFVSYCSNLPLKLTSLRKEILYILWSTEKPIKAYDILSSLIKTKPNATPPTVYRSLDFFVASNILHKIESIQSYTLCCEPVKNLSTEILMVCNTCHDVIETYNTDFHKFLNSIAIDKKFQLNHDAIELKGTCNSCLK
ncbi:MAG: Fur family transcriptional regulator [Legionellaceae bacterium]|nr:Fur family transcriptional regulator [Legionellaceae bacterium]